MKMAKTNDVYSTKDLYVASLIYAAGQKFLGLREQDRYFWFIFEDKSACQKLADGYWSGEAVINAKAYADAIRTLKDRLFSQRA